ncbi:lytic transglycosylase F [Pseudovibrio exalbescens]|uniref:transglycosylase SLT domain-containing protein n=1 Tax=Pseudovibrio exalbescens TaxID=197461 RepID=UPI002366B47C|nr:lytic transglycosylase F [Pseudovibrio exalbescens]MDD7910232.1 lytic transglycosylase F [Pseudovibrio exalbescens]
MCSRWCSVWLSFFVLISALLSPGLALEDGKQIDEVTNAEWAGDLDGMRKRGFIRALVPFSLTSFYIDNGKERGLQAQLLNEFEKQLNVGVDREQDKVRVLVIPTTRDQLFPKLISGKGDLIAANLTVTADRMKDVDFGDPVYQEAKEIVATAPGEAPVEVLADLAGRQIYVREDSSFYPSLEAANVQLAEKGLELIDIQLADERLEAEDILEMVNAGAIPATVVDQHVGQFWSKVFPKFVMNTDVVLRDRGHIAWALRQDSPKLLAEVNAFMKEAKIGTLLGNMLAKEQMELADRFVDPSEEEYLQKLKELRDLFLKFGEKYDIDPSLLAAQAFQESRFDPNARSAAGAVGIMQLLPSTALDPNVDIKNYESLEGNIEAGAKYMRFLADHYFPETEIPEFEKMMMVFASYNAGPNRVKRVRPDAPDPNMWFRSVEWEVAEAAGSEPIRYVKNIYRYYLLFDSMMQRSEVLRKVRTE